MKKSDQILHYFPEVSLPVIVSDEYQSEYENNNDPFPQSFIDEIILEWEKEIDEFTEFIPCFKIPKQEKFYAVVYLKLGLLQYDFVMVTVDHNGQLISKKSIASTLVEGNTIKKSVASIETDLIINIIAGQTTGSVDYDASLSRTFSMEIMHSGEIIFNMD